jgi:Rho GDP-dissociation inhibitor
MNVIADWVLVEADTAPSGMLARGKYSASSKFVDDDNVTHLQFDWTFEIKKDWQ